jgi:CheY-like chemotaxis protein
MADVPDSKSEILFSEFLAGRKILVVDPVSTSRISVVRILVSLGAKTNQINAVQEYSQAVEDIRTRKPTVVVTEFEFPIVNKSAFGLIECLRQEGITPEQSLFVILTGNNSQSAIAQAAEEDVDTFILKPYSVNSFKKLIISTTLTKIYPSDYAKLILQGKTKLSEGRPEEAIEAFNEATKQDAKPSLALFYRGQAELFKKLLDNAENSYQGGLKYNDVHYKCMTGLFDLLLERNKLTDAYEVVKKISKFFPSNPRRMNQVLKLAVATGNMQDIESFYETFKTIDQRDDELVRYISAALVVCGKHFFRKGDSAKGADLLQKAAVSCAGRTNVLRQIVVTLAENGLADHASQVLKRMPEGQDDTRTAKMILRFFNKEDPEILIGETRDLISAGNQDLALYMCMIQCYKRIDKPEEVKQWTEEAIQKHPSERESLEALQKQT